MKSSIQLIFYVRKNPRMLICKNTDYQHTIKKEGVVPSIDVPTPHPVQQIATPLLMYSLCCRMYDTKGQGYRCSCAVVLLVRE
jgi:hypothetical protein